MKNRLCRVIMLNYMYCKNVNKSFFKLKCFWFGLQTKYASTKALQGVLRLPCDSYQVEYIWVDALLKPGVEA